MNIRVRQVGWESGSRHITPTHQPNLSMINFNIILPSMPRSYKRSLPFTFYNQNPHTFQSDDAGNVS